MHCLGGCFKAFLWTIAIVVAASIGWPVVLFVVLLMVFVNR